MARKKRKLTPLDLDFISILDLRPKYGQFILLAWDINGYCGYESTYWDKDDDHCKHAVAWFPLPENHVYGRKCAVALKTITRNKPVILKWSKHFSKHNGAYISTDKMPRTAYEEKYITTV